MESNLVPLEGQCILITSKASLHLLHTLYLIFSNLVWWIFLLFFHSANERTKMKKSRQPMSREQKKDDLGCSTSRKKVYVSMNSGTIRVISQCLGCSLTRACQDKQPSNGQGIKMSHHLYTVSHVTYSSIHYTKGPLTFKIMYICVQSTKMFGRVPDQNFAELNLDSGLRTFLFPSLSF